MERARGAILGIVESRVSGARVLDAYAGSGALGIEALSRGAAHATFVEASRSALAALRYNLESLDLTRVSTVVPIRFERSQSALGRAAPFDLAFCDPPWGEVERAMDALVRVLVPVLADGALVVVEHRARRPPRPRTELSCIDERAWGDTGASFFCANRPV